LVKRKPELVTAEDYERLLAAEGMPAELSPTDTKYLCGPSSAHLRARFPELQSEIDQVHVTRTCADQFYSRATDILWSGELSRTEFRVWELFCAGHGRVHICRVTKLSKWTVVETLAAIQKRYGLGAGRTTHE
jgi:hypothetical protein